jgi:acyl carrier protein
MYVLDDALNPVPLGVFGEIFIGGVGLARGYLNRAALTAVQFLPDPLTRTSDERMYRTGDLGRYRSNGEIEYLGRKDQQVKLRGFRIELGEIQSVLASNSEIREAVVMLKADQRLVAYLVAREHPVSIEELRDWVKSKLPDYMAPSAFVWLDEIPLTTSGKVDRRTLDALDAPQTPAARFVAPRTELEKLTAGVWAELLGVEGVGLYDNFFELGGHSLRATQVMSRLRAALGIDLPLRALFDNPTVAGLAAKAETGLRAVQSIPITPARERAASDEGLPLSFAQERLWFTHLLARGDAAYNIATALRLSGYLDLDALERSLTEIAHRHDSLRTTFAQVDGQPFQLISEANTIKIAQLDLSDFAEQEREAEVRRLSHEQARLPFDLSAGPLWRVLLFRLQPEEHVLLLTMHHIITDGWSFGIFARELVALYQAFSQNEPSPLAELPIQYADFAAWQRNWLRGEVLDQQLDYWRAQLSGAPPVLKLPLDHPRPAAPSSRGARVSFQLDFETTRLLHQLSRHTGVTLFMTLLAAFKMLLQRYTREDDIVVGADIANRNRTEIESLIGFFVNMLVLRTDLSGDPTFVELLARVREVALGAYAHQDLPFARLVDELQLPRDTNYSPLFQVVFVLQNAPAEAVKIPGLNIVGLPVDTEAVPFDMVLSMWEGKEGLAGSLAYRTDLFEHASAERLVNHLHNLLEALVQTPEQRLSSFSLLAQEDVQEYFKETLGGLNLSQRELEGVILELQRASTD